MEALPCVLRRLGYKILAVTTPSGYQNVAIRNRYISLGSSVIDNMEGWTMFDIRGTHSDQVIRIKSRFILSSHNNVDKTLDLELNPKMLFKSFVKIVRCEIWST